MTKLKPEIESLIQRVRGTGLTQREIAESADLNYWWVNSFMQGRIPNPGWLKVEKLVEFLDSHGSSKDSNSDSPGAIRDSA